jgi:hypothetical protein
MAKKAARTARTTTKKQAAETSAAATATKPLSERLAEMRSGKKYRNAVFGLDEDNGVAIYETLTAARASGAQPFTSEAELGNIAGEGNARLVEIHNSITGVTPVKRFMDRKAALRRTFAALADSLLRQIDTSKPDPEPELGNRKGITINDSTEVIRAGGASKKDAVLAMFAGGAEVTLDELVAATGWQKHSIRGFLSGTMHKKMGMQIASSRNASGQRVYRVQSSASVAA